MDSQLAEIIQTQLQIDAYNQQLDNYYFQLALENTQLVKLECKLASCENNLALNVLIANLQNVIAAQQLQVSNDVTAIAAAKAQIISDAQGLNCTCFWSSLMATSS